MADIRRRDDVAPQYKWDLTHIYPNDEAWEAAMAETFEGVGKGFGGEIKVAATIEGGKLTAVEVLSHGETAGISDPAIANMPNAIVEAESTEVDNVSGATITSKAIKAAVNDALAQAK